MGATAARRRGTLQRVHDSVYALARYGNRVMARGPHLSDLPAAWAILTTPCAACGHETLPLNYSPVSCADL